MKTLVSLLPGNAGKQLMPHDEPVRSHAAVAGRLHTFVRPALLFGDCLTLMPELETNSVDMVLADLPFGSTLMHFLVFLFWRLINEHFAGKS